MIRYILLPLLAMSTSAFVLQGNPCKQAGFYALIDNTPKFYECYPKKHGGFILKILTCPMEQVFSASFQHCVPKLKLRALSDNDDQEIENRTKPSAENSNAQPDTENPTKPTTKGPEQPTKEPEEPEHSTEKPEKPTEEPENTTEEPEKPTEEPEEPEKPTEAPEKPTEEPEKPTEAPEKPTEEPEKPTEEPEKPTEEPEKPTEEPEHPTDEPETTTDTPTKPTETTSPQPVICTAAGFFPSSGACNKFLYCMSGKGDSEPIELTCPPKQQFNPDTLFCDSNYDCEPTKPTETTTPQPFICPTTGFFPANGACNKFIYCMSRNGDSEPIEVTCPAKQQFNPDTLFCDSNYDCEADDIKIVKQLEFDCIMEGIFPDENDEAKYFVCTWNEVLNSFQYQHKHCEKNEIFYKLTGKCGRHLELPKALQHLGH